MLMAIAAISKPFSSKGFNLRLSRRLRSKTDTTTSPPQTTSPRGVGEFVVSPKPAGSKEDEFQQVFRFLDADNDGKICADELTAYFATIGDSLSREEAERIIGEFSKGGDGGSMLLEFVDFVRVMEFRGGDGGGGDGVDVLRQAFEVYEEEKGSGCITPEGLREVLRRLGDVKSVQECKDMIRAYDLDGNGVLDFDEFYKMMT